MRIFELYRMEDESGNSGTGRVAEVIRFTDGVAVLHWHPGLNALGVKSTVVYESLSDLIKVHGHAGKTELREITDGRFARLTQVLRAVLESDGDEALGQLARAEAFALLGEALMAQQAFTVVVSFPDQTTMDAFRRRIIDGEAIADFEMEHGVNFEVVGDLITVSK